ncbi:MAG: hypothetical protein NUV59_01940 [Patescibacteria group bacterium]|nr:hypothetical protein [Patescibacteria group bacterium]
MTKLLFLGCNTDQLPYLKVAKDKGYEVVATDMNEEAPGAQLADSFHKVGYEDEKGLTAVGSEEHFTAGDKVFTAASQFAYLGASSFAEHFSIPFIPHESILTCLDKTRLYPLFERYGLAVPEWHILEKNGIPAALKEFGTMYVKSDFGKSPNYCFRVSDDASLPALPKEHDRYFRKSFIVQKEIKGAHYRVNWVRGALYAFRKETDEVSHPAPDFALDNNTRANLSRMLEGQGLASHLVKFDIIVADGTTYFLDIGLEPPMRLGLYLSHCGYDFPRLYLEHLVEGKIGYPNPKSLPTDLTIRGRAVS